jgi:predicted nucleotide-binding protein (sugar kinase/HSP70/actin superfamily)
MAPLTSISRDFSIPLLHLIIDEHSGEAGIRTRLEAFIDLLKHRKTKNNNETIEYIKNEQSIGAVH